MSDKIRNTRLVRIVIFQTVRWDAIVTLCSCDGDENVRRTICVNYVNLVKLTLI